MPKITMVGAGSAGFTQKLITDILSTPELSDSEIALMDIDRDRLATAEKIVRQVVAQLECDAQIEAHLDRKRALEGADYVITSVHVGMRAAGATDFSIPRRYGLKQTIGDTLGVGGIFRGLRTIPVIVGTCRDMEAVCPDAVLLNYTNPMAMLMMAVAKATHIKGVGLCHSVQGTSKRLAHYIGVPHDEVTYRVAGINHMAWFLEFKHRGRDAYPLLWGALEDPEVFAKDKVRFEMMRRTGYFVTESSTHFSEYVPYFLQRDELIEAFDIPLEQYLRNQERKQNRFEETRRRLEAGETLEITRSHEYAASIIHSIETGKSWSFNGNVANTGLITNLPEDACVEVPCLVNQSGIQPCYFGALPTHLAALNTTNVNVQQLTVEAALTGNRDRVYQAVMLDPNASSVLSLDDMWRVADELIEAHGDLLPQFHGDRVGGRRHTTG